LFTDLRPIRVLKLVLFGKRKTFYDTLLISSKLLIEKKIEFSRYTIAVVVAVVRKALNLSLMIYKLYLRRYTFFKRIVRGQR
jgi:hypothetical protein